jgi:hypothetical protein
MLFTVVIFPLTLVNCCAKSAIIDLESSSYSFTYFCKLDSFEVKEKMLAIVNQSAELTNRVSKADIFVHSLQLYFI